ncbi:putative tyrosinase [Ascodesmis nigricans]|uniref:Putative tyrosinase n=1 Tax=Ascodesmis nigricans TaxID=341454 RepID=A0A4S2MHI4_9PEZI|nr:putative tyrosinase [Ascodesmis nigricans]
MLYKKIIGFALTALALTNASPVASDPAPGSIEDAQTVEDLAKVALELLGEDPSVFQKRGQCNIFNAAVRREWGTIPKAQRKEYTDAVKCLMNKPPRTSKADAPGVHNRYDDFVATHVNQTMQIHETGNFLVWHRYFVWAFEQALRNECGYKGYQPYWNWARDHDNPHKSAMFDGSEYSMSGDGDYVPHGGSCLDPAGTFCIPPGNGGGCVNSGPFAGMNVTLGPVTATMDGVLPAPGNGLGDNPRCLKRDISVYLSKNYLTDNIIFKLIAFNPTIARFQKDLQGDLPTMGVHIAGHFTINGDPGSDVFTSPGDPAFWLHHGMIDRVWWIWQNLNRSKRLHSIAGTITFMNNPPSRDATLDDLMDLGVSGAPIPLRDGMDTMAGPFCYIYL